MSVSLPIFECDHCGACCRRLIVQATHEDAMREPRITQEARLLDGNGKLELSQAEWGMNKMSKGDDGANGFPCVFLEGNRCGIYPTRPYECVACPAGGEKCQQAREMDGLPPLAPTVRVPRNMSETLAAKAVEWEAAES